MYQVKHTGSANTTVSMAAENLDEAIELIRRALEQGAPELVLINTERQRTFKQEMTT